MKSERVNIEWPTIGLLIVNYLAWWSLLSNFQQAPLLYAFLLTIVLALHNSLVHEMVHGHPTHIRWLNDLIAYPPLALIFPYPVFKSSHLTHHTNSNLTIPGVDPESFFQNPTHWQNKPAISRWFAWIYMTLAGRLLLNPVVSSVSMIRLATQQLKSGTAAERLTWPLHIAGCTLVLMITHHVYQIPIVAYLLCAYFAQSLISLRAFFEHRTALNPDHRIVVVRSCWFFKLLFLNNNYHAIHHRYPRLPWYQIPQRYREESEQVLERNGNFYFGGYSSWLKYLVRPVASPVFPEPTVQTQGDS
jgi:fatty acid desaturase